MRIRLTYKEMCKGTFIALGLPFKDLFKHISKFFKLLLKAFSYTRNFVFPLISIIIMIFLIITFPISLPFFRYFINKQTISGYQRSFRWNPFRDSIEYRYYNIRRIIKDENQKI